VPVNFMYILVLPDFSFRVNIEFCMVEIPF
jgi:hypothetical protein